jgi:hypothetical protein
MMEPGTFSMMTSLSGKRPLAAVVDELAEEGRDAFVDEAGHGAMGC